MLKIIRNIALGLLALLALAALALHFSARAALDRDFTYSAATQRLPWFAADAPDGVVQLKSGEFTFRARIAGFAQNPRGPLVLLLHGFPTTSAMYIDLIPQLAAAGYRVVAPDQRGYSPGARPQGAQAYRVDLLAGDMFDLATTLGAQRLHLVGHDWGAVVGWQMVLAAPERISSWSALSIPHTAAFQEAIREDPEQRRRSSYFLLFATPWLAESLFAMGDMAALRAMLAPMNDVQMREYLAMLREPGALTAAFNWYRATLSLEAAQAAPGGQVDTPTLFVWGGNDPAVARYGVEAQRQYMQGPFQEIEVAAGHWLLREQGEATAAAILAHIDRFKQ